MRNASGSRNLTGTSSSDAESSMPRGKQPQERKEDGNWIETPMNRRLSDGRVTAVRESKNYGNQYGTHVTRDGMGERDSMDAINVTGKTSKEGLTLNKGNIMSKKQMEEGNNGRKPSSREGETEYGGDNKCGMAKKGQGKGKAIAGERKSMKGCSVFEKPKTGNSTPSKGNLSFNNSKVECN
jgi:hypothetical protein